MTCSATSISPLGNAQLLGPVLEELLTKGHNIRVRNLDKFCGLHDSLSRGSGVVWERIEERSDELELSSEATS